MKVSDHQVSSEKFKLPLIKKPQRNVGLKFKLRDVYKIQCDLKETKLLSTY